MVQTCQALYSLGFGGVDKSGKNFRRRFMKNKLFFSAMLASLLVFGLTLSSCAPSAAKRAIMSAASVEEVTGLKNKLTWLQSNAESGDSYIIKVNLDEIIDKTDDFSEIFTGSFSYKGNLSYKGKSDITIILKGVGTNRTISREYNGGTVFTVGSGVTLVLDNIKIQTGRRILAGPPSRGALVEVSDGGTLVMNDGSTITGAVYPDNGIPGKGEYVSINSGGGVHIFNGGTLEMNDGSTIIFNTNNFSNGGGVYVSSGGTFIMKGGIITSNVCFPIPDVAMMLASKGKFNATGEEHYKGGGVYVSGKGTFTKTGGTITGYASDLGRGNQVRDFAGNKLAQNSGHAIYFAGSKSIDATVGPEESFNFRKGKFSENVVETVKDTQGSEREILTDRETAVNIKTVKIGEQVWMAENLNYDMKGSKCYDNKSANCSKYGRLYYWNTAVKSCPSGWHLPSKSEWEALDKAVGGGNVAGKKLKAKNGWNSNGNGTDQYGFFALPGGNGSSDGSFDNVGDYGSWWSASDDNSNNAYYRYMNYGSEEAYWHNDSKYYLHSVRCLQD
jgi:uncharacterized protein (TIGR02145 family)